MPLMKGAGAIVRDSSGNGNYGRITGATWIAGRSGSGLSFDGVDDYVTIPRRNHDEISLCAWFYKNENDTSGSDGIISGFRGNEDIQLREGFEMRFSPDRPDVLEFGLVTQDRSGTRTMNTARYNLVKSVGSWYHIAGTYNKTTGEQRLYVNGQLVNTQVHPAGNTIVPQTYYPDMRIGYSPIASGYFNGVIDDVRLYNHPITDGEVRDLYDAFRADMDVYYAFDVCLESV